MTEFNPENDEVHSSNKAKMYEKRNQVRIKIKELLKDHSSDDLIFMIMQETDKV